MRNEEFTERDEAYKKFIAYRKEIMSKASTDGFSDAFVELCTKAYMGDNVAQDCVAYFFNKGVPGQLNVNYEYYMSWEILAASNGNEFAIEKLEFIMKPSLDALFSFDKILKEAMRRNNITKENALLVIPKLICKQVVEDLKIDPKNLIDLDIQTSEPDAQKARKFEDAMFGTLPKVAEILIS